MSLARILGLAVSAKTGAISNHGTGKYQHLFDRYKNLKAVPTAVVRPCKASALAGTMEAAGVKLIHPILVGPKA